MTDIKKGMVAWDNKPKIDPKLIKWEDAQALKNPNALDYDKLEYAPTVGMSGLDRRVAGYQQMVRSVVPGIQQYLPDALGGISNEQIAEQKKLDAPLLATPEGQQGAAAGSALLSMPFAMAPGANSVKGAAGYGALFGMLQPATTPEERIINAGKGGLLSGGITKATNMVGRGAMKAAGRTTPGESTVPGLDAALDAGYKVTPKQAEQGILGELFQGISGTAKLEKSASMKNQKVTNELVKGELGIQKDKPISIAELDAIRSKAGESYEAVKTSVKAIKPDAQFRADLDALRGDYSAAAKEFPDLIKNDDVEALIKGLNIERASPASMVELTKKLRKDGSVNLKSMDDPAKRELGMAQRSAADAIEGMIDRALSSVGKDGLVSQWRTARQTIAKTYDVESALNDSTGNVSSITLGKLMKKGKPLTGGLERVGSFARQFESSARDVDKMKDTPGFNFADLVLGGAGVAGTGNMMGLGVLGARPAVRETLLSAPYQKTLSAPGLLSPKDQMLLEGAKRAALPLGIGGGLLAYPQQ